MENIGEEIDKNFISRYISFGFWHNDPAARNCNTSKKLATNFQAPAGCVIKILPH